MKATRRLGLSAALLLVSSLAQAEWSANIGYASEYIYRGFPQVSSSANGGIDYEHNGFYAGTWAADVDDGLEVDGYFGYSGQYQELSYSIGFTGYYYTGDFDDTYQELNFGLGYSFVNFDVAVGEYDNFDGPTQDFAWYALTVEKNGLYGRYATLEDDFSGDYFEFGYNTSFAEIDLGIVLVINDEDLNGTDGTDETLLFTLGKTFMF